MLTSKVKRSIFILGIATIVSIYSLSFLKFKNTPVSTNIFFSIIIEYFGIDAEEIERSITLPLEQKLFELDDLIEIKSQASLGKNLTILTFSPETNCDTTYLNIQNLLETLYLDLPQAVQKPQIRCFNSESPVTICYSLDFKSPYQKQILKSQLESIDGITQVLITGNENENINIIYSLDKLNHYSISPKNIAESIATNNHNDIFFSKSSNLNSSTFHLRNKITSIKDFSDIKIHSENGTIDLHTISDIQLSPHELSELNLLNNKETCFLAIKTAYDANLILIANKVSSILRSNSENLKNVICLYNIGTTAKENFTKVALTFVFTFVIISTFIFIFFSSFTLCILFIFTILITICCTLGTFPLLNLSLTTNILSALSLSLGIISDIPLIIIEYHYNSKSSLKNIIQNSLKPIILSSITTIVVLIPLLYLNKVIPGLKDFCIVIILSIIYSTLISLIFLPQFLELVPLRTQKADCSQFLNNIIQTSLHFSFQNNRKLFIFFLISLLSIPVLLSVTPLNFVNDSNNPSSLSAIIEFNTERQKEQIRSDIKTFLETLNTYNQIKYTKAKIIRGKAELEIIGSTPNNKELSTIISNNKHLIQNGTLFLTENNSKKKKTPMLIQIAITGPDINLTQNMTKKAAKAALQNKDITSTTLNFKDSETFFRYETTRDKVENYKLTVRDIASSLRTIIHPPVISKCIIDNKETDVILSPAQTISTSNLENLYIPIKNNSYLISSLGKINKESKVPTIFHLNTIRCSYFTIETYSNNILKVLNKITNDFKILNPQDGYNIKIPNSIIQGIKIYNLLKYITILTFIILLLLLISQTERFQSSILICLCTLSQTFLPLILLLTIKKNLDIGSICGLSILCGININTLIYISESKIENVIEKVKSKIKSIIITSFSTLLSSFPLLIFSNEAFTKSLCFIIFYGTISSLITSVIIYPVLYEELKKKSDLNKKKPGSYLLSHN